MFGRATITLGIGPHSNVFNIDHIVSLNQGNHCIITLRRSAASTQLPKSRHRVDIIDWLDFKFVRSLRSIVSTGVDPVDSTWLCRIGRLYWSTQSISRSIGYYIIRDLCWSVHLSLTIRYIRVISSETEKNKNRENMQQDGQEGENLFKILLAAQCKILTYS